MPPPEPVELPVMVQSVNTTVSGATPIRTNKPPPSWTAELPLTVVFVRVIAPKSSIPPPYSPAELPLTVQSTNAIVP